MRDLHKLIGVSLYMVNYSYVLPRMKIRVESC